ncbi:MAG: hypothetical protein WCS43_01390 [Verrucomicrobiota bacterium]
MKENHKNPFVTLWDESTNTFTRIPKFELAPGMVSCRVPDRKEEVWREAKSIHPATSSYRHPPFKGEMRSMIESVVDAFPGLLEWSYEEWEDLLRKDTNPDREIRYWIVVARVFREFAEGRAFEYQKEIYRFLTICNTTPREFLPVVFEPKRLLAGELEKIADAYYGHFAG